LGCMYFEGSGVKKNDVLAHELLEKAANQGAPLAKAMLGSMHFDGKNLKQDYAKAKELLGRMCDNDIQPACDEYKKLVARGK